MQSRSALLVGASGLIGGHLLQLLLDDDAYNQVTVLVRKPLALRHSKLQEYVVNFDQLDKHKDSLRAHDVFCCLGTTIKVAGSQEAFRKVDCTYVVQTAALTLNNGAEQFLMVSSVGANTNSRVFYSRVKGEVEDAVSKLPYKAVQIFRPSFLLGDRKELRRGEKMAIVLMKSLSFALAGSLRRYRAIYALTVAKAMLAVAKQQIAGVAIYESERIQVLGQV
ncbi:MAG: NAD(P)H-binding protein [Ignavibacteriales bacterium]|nr:NAD(P)H-binding protein [Ignavibacteriales bacterium]